MTTVQVQETTVLKPLPSVRLAVREDESELMDLCRALHRENGLFAFSEDRVRDCLQRFWNRQGTIVGVIGPSGAIEASSCLMIADFYYTLEWHLAELWNFVAEPYRESRNAEALLQFCIRSAEKLGIPLVTGIITNKRLAAKVRLYRRSLGPPAGAFFIHGAKWQEEVLPQPDEFWRRPPPRYKRGNGHA